MHFAQYQSTSFITLDLPEHPDSIVSCVIKGKGGGDINASATYTTSSVNTTLAASASIGATSLVVSSSTGITVGSKYLVGSSQSTLGEFVTVKSISGTTASLLRPLTMAQPVNSEFTTTQVKVTVGTTDSSTIGRHNRVDLVYVANGVSGSATQSFDVVRFFPVSNLTIEDVRDFDSIFEKKLPKGFNFAAIKDKAWDMLLVRIAGKTNVGSIVGTLDLTIPHQYLVRKLLAETAGPEHKEYCDEMTKRATEELHEVLQSHTVDIDEDGAISSTDVFPTFIKLVRG